MWELRMMFSSYWIVLCLHSKGFKKLRVITPSPLKCLTEICLNINWTCSLEPVGVLNKCKWLNEWEAKDWFTILQLQGSIKKHGSSTCDMNALIKLPCDGEIWAIYVQIWEAPSVCGLQLTYAGWGMGQGRRAHGTTRWTSINQTFLHGSCFSMHIIHYSNMGEYSILIGCRLSINSW